MVLRAVVMHSPVGFLAAESVLVWVLAVPGRQLPARHTMGLALGTWSLIALTISVGGWDTNSGPNAGGTQTDTSIQSPYPAQ